MQRLTSFVLLNTGTLSNYQKAGWLPKTQKE